MDPEIWILQRFLRYIWILRPELDRSSRVFFDHGENIVHMDKPPPMQSKMA